MENLIVGNDGLIRCGWCGNDTLYQAYHDREWGYPALDDRRQFEFIVLESAQAGLSWITILRKRDAYREAYADFNPDVVSRWGDAEINLLMINPGIVKNRRKIEASIGNAGIFLDISARFGSFAEWLMKFYDGKPQVNRRESLENIPVTSPQAEAISKELKALGFKFFGPVIAYSHLQATGIVDDHLNSCWRKNS